MNKYGALLSTISRKYAIYKGKNESETEWKVRIIYSICGMMAYTSLWDEVNEEPVSIIHLKHRIKSVYDSYKELYPEINSFFPQTSDELESEITDVFQNSGVFYHRPNRLAPSKYSSALVDNICFQRGLRINSIQNVSGIGFYSHNLDSTSSLTIKKMFDLEEQTLSELWKSVISNAKWHTSNEFTANTEYLKLEPPFTRSYWVTTPYKKGEISLLRTGLPGAQLYYLYRYINNKLELSPLPQWQVKEHHYRAIASAKLKSIGVLPGIEYSIDDNLVHIHINYLLPPRELYWIKLYSWPEKCNTLPCDFRRKCSLNVFHAIQRVLYDDGYIFIER